VTRGWYLQGASETQGSYKKPGAAANAATNKDVEVSFPQYDEEAQT
jgi:hypothetical protein